MTIKDMIKAVIFDMDGTVLDSTQADFSAWQKIFQELGKSFTFETYKELVGMKSTEFFTKVLGKITDEKNEELTKKKELYAIENAQKNGLEVTPGLKKLVEDLKSQNFKIALATAAPFYRAQAYLKIAGLQNFFPIIVTSDLVKHAKPNPEIFLISAQKINTRPEDCIVFEDATNGVLAAKAAGMKCIAITTTHNREELQQADRIIDSFEELTVEDIKQL